RRRRPPRPSGRRRPRPRPHRVHLDQQDRRPARPLRRRFFFRRQTILVRQAGPGAPRRLTPSTPPMSTYLLVHNYYQQRGGEAAILEAEADLLEAHGRRVLRYTLHNDRIDAMSNVQRLAATLWNHRVYRELRAFIRDMRPEVAHFHN